MNCVFCNSKLFTKKGFNRKNQQQYKCKNCDRIYTGQEKFHRFTQEDISTADKMKAEGLGYRAIARVLGRTNHIGLFKLLKKS